MKRKRIQIIRINLLENQQSLIDNITVEANKVRRFLDSRLNSVNVVL